MKIQKKVKTLILQRQIKERRMLLSKCAVCNSKKSRFIKEQEASGLLTSLGLKIVSSKIPLLSEQNVYTRNKMNEIVNKFLLAGDKFMP